MKKPVKQIVSFSGGAASFAAAVELLWKYPKEDKCTPRNVCVGKRSSASALLQLAKKA